MNPADMFGGATDRPYKDYVAADIAVLQTCDAIAMLDGWDGPNARGSCWEREVAKTLLGLPVYDAACPIPWSQCLVPIPLTRGPDGTLGRFRTAVPGRWENSCGER